MSSYPENGNIAQVRHFGDNQNLRTQSLSSLRDDVARLQGSAGIAEWNGDMADAYRARLTRMHGMLADVASVTDHWDRTARTYADTLDAMTFTAQQARYDVSSCIAIRDTLLHVPPDSLPPGYWAHKVEEVDQRISHGHRILEALHQQRMVVDTAFASALAYVGCAGQSVNWAGMVSLYADAATVDDIRAHRAELLAEANKLADAVEGSKADPEDVDALTKLLAAMAADPSLAGEFWKGRGGEDALKLLEAGLGRHMLTNGSGYVSEEDREPALAFARSIRESLASGSSTWNELTSRDFAAQMLTHSDWPGGGVFIVGDLTGVGFLFDDAEHHPMGATFTTATADLFDTRERGEGIDGGARGSSGLEQNGQYGRFDLIAEADELDRGCSYESSGMAGPARDAMGRVLDTLGKYPDAAWEWLSADGGTLANGSPAMASDKVEYWSTRNWTADGWDGFGSLWEGSMHATGGIASDVTTSYTWNAQCDVASRIVIGLDNGGHLIVGSLTGGGGASLGNAIGHLVPFAEFQGYSAFPPPHAGDPSIVSVESPEGQDPTRAMAYIPLNAFGDVVSSLVSNGDGFAAIRTAVTQVETGLLVNANVTGTYEAWDDALGRYAHLEASLEGAVGGSEIMQARLGDAAIRQKMDIVSAATSFLPGVGLAGGVGKIADFAVGQGTSAFVGSITDSLANNEALAQSLLGGSETAGAAGLQSRIVQMDTGSEWSLGDVNPENKSRETWFSSFSSDHRDGFYSSVWEATDNE